MLGRTDKTWSIIVVHQELDNVEQAFTKAKSNIENGTLETALQEIETTIYFVEHVKDRERLCLKKFQKHFIFFEIYDKIVQKEKRSNVWKI